MPPSNGDRSVEAIAEELDDDANPDEIHDILTTLVRRRMDDMGRETDMTTRVVDLVLPRLDHRASDVRSAAALLLRHAVLFKDVEPFEQSRTTLVERLLELMDDDSWRVRQIVLQGSYFTDKFGSAPNDAVEAAKPVSWLAERLFDRLEDPVPAVRKRSAYVIENSQQNLVVSHPDPSAAVATLLRAVDDPISIRSVGRATRPSHAALVTLSDLIGTHSTLVTEQLGALVAHFHHEKAWKRGYVGQIIVDLIDEGAISHEQIVDDVLEALESNHFPLKHHRHAELLVLVALENQTVRDHAIPLLREKALEDDRAREKTRFAAADGLGRLVRESDRTDDPVAETIARETAERSFLDEAVDPLIPLTPGHPEFVAERLRSGVSKRLREDRTRINKRFSRDLLLAVAERDLAVLDPTVELLVEEAADSTALECLTHLAEAYPERIAVEVPALIERLGTTPPISMRYCRLLAATVGEDPQIPAALVSALVDTVAPTGKRPKANDRRRYWAVRTLVELYEQGHDAVPDRIEPFVTASRNGELDEVVDPLGLPAAETAGYSTEFKE